MTEVTTATSASPELPDAPPDDGGTPRWWAVIHLLAAALTGLDALSGSVPLVSLRIGPDGSTTAVLTGYTTAAILYVVFWGRAARGRPGALTLIKVAFGIATFSALLSLGGLTFLGGDGWSELRPLESRATELVQDLIILAALAVFVRNYRDLPGQRVSERAIHVMSGVALLVALVTGAVAATVAGRAATPAEAVERTAPLLAAATLEDAADEVRHRATWRPWEHWTISGSGWNGADGASGEGSGTRGLPGSAQRTARSWLLLEVDDRKVCLTRSGNDAPVQRGLVSDCRSRT